MLYFFFFLFAKSWPKAWAVSPCTPWRVITGRRRSRPRRPGMGVARRRHRAARAAFAIATGAGAPLSSRIAGSIAAKPCRLHGYPATVTSACGTAQTGEARMPLRNWTHRLFPWRHPSQGACRASWYRDPPFHHTRDYPCRLTNGVPGQLFLSLIPITGERQAC